MGGRISDIISKEINEINFDRIRLFSFVIMILGLLLVLADPFISDLNDKVFRYLMYDHIYIFVTGLGFSLYTFFTKTKKHGTLFAMLYSTVILISGIVISGFFDTVLDRGIIVYLLTILLISFVILIDSPVFIGIFSLGFITFLALLFTFQKDKNILIGNVINASIFFVVSFFLLRSNFKKKVKEIEQNYLIHSQKKKIEEKNKTLEDANHKLSQQNQEIEAQKEHIIRQKDKILQQNNEITDSIVYAKNIQLALLSSEDLFKSHFSDYFILYKPKEIISGDFYWISRINNKIAFCVADCTGHGVPGAFMSLLGISLLNEITHHHVDRDKVQTNEILNILRSLLITSLHQKGSFDESLDGMDVALCLLNTETNELQFSGANNPLWIIRNNKPLQGFQTLEGVGQETLEGEGFSLEELRGDKMPIGIQYGKEKDFTSQIMQLSEGDILYLFSDGFSDQFGGNKGKKLKKQFLKDTLTELSVAHTMPDIKTKLENIIFEWKSTIDKETGEVFEQTDDITILGLKL